MVLFFNNFPLKLFTLVFIMSIKIKDPSARHVLDSFHVLISAIFINMCQHPACDLINALLVTIQVPLWSWTTGDESQMCIIKQ